MGSHPSLPSWRRKEDVMGTNTVVAPTFTQSTLDRACTEFLEMPGERLTRRQAQRLWGLDETTCAELLDYLVDAKFLARCEGGMYRRTENDAVSRPRLPA
jgi:hypothetical protein